MTLPAPLSHPPPQTLAPGSPWHARPARIDRVRDESADVRTMVLVFEQARDRRDYRFLPGQFNMLLLPGIGEAAISIASDPEHCSAVAHTVRAVGSVTHALARLEVGDQLFVRGPFGRPWPLGELRDRDLIIAAGGVGLASVQAAICHCMNHRGDYGRIAVLHGAKTPADLLCRSDYGRWRDHGIDLHLIVDHAAPGWQGPVGFVPQLLDRLEIVPSETSLICCGPEPMMEAVARRSIAAGIDPGQIFVSIERLMACASGLCGLCQLGPFFICKDGPVLSYDRIGPWLAVPHL